MPALALAASSHNRQRHQHDASSRPERNLIATIARLIKGSLKPRAPGRKTPSLKDLQAIRKALVQSIEDLESLPAQRLRHKIVRAQTPQELWLLRNDAYQLISQQTNQAVAAERINGLLSQFEGWLEPRQLVRIK